MTLPDWVASWLEKLSLDEWVNVATIFGAIGTFIVAITDLFVSVGALRMQSQALRAQREALPVSVAFGLTGRGYVDGGDGVRWLAA